MRSFAASLAGAAPLVGAAALCFSLIAILGHGPPWAAFTPVGAPAESCDALATRLSEAYASNSTYPGGDNLESWMAENGALVILCTPDRDPDTDEPTCFDDGAVYSQMDHVSASWVANGQWFVFLGYSVGKVLDPLRVKVRCVYPTDGGTASRDDAGCGPKQSDPRFGSIGAAKASRGRKQDTIRYFEDLMFKITGRADATWRDVNCSQIYQKWYVGQNYTMWHSPDLTSLESCEQLTLAPPEAFLDSSQAHVESYYSFLNKRHFEPFLGHPACVDDGPSCDDPLGSCSPAVTRGHNVWEYVGPCSWPPSRFAQSEAAKSAMLERGTRGRENDSVFIWNEIILGTEAKRSEAVLAAFWVNATTHLPTNLILNITLDEEEVNFRRAAARAHARALGTEHVLVVDPSTEALEARATFTCDDGER